MTGWHEGSRRFRANLVLCGLAVLVTVLVVAAPAGAAPGPAWQLSTASYPTNLVPGTSPAGDGESGEPQYDVFATNVGPVATSAAEPTTITVTLAAGLTPVGPVITNNSSEQAQVKEEPCAISGQTVTCEAPVALGPGRLAKATIPVEVSLTAAPSLTSTVSVAGGGTPSVSSTTTTTVSSTPAAFRITSLGATLVGPEGTTATQAGSHPFQLITELGLPGQELAAEPGYMRDLVNGNHLRDLTMNLPRGLVVNPDATSVRCTEAQLEEVVEGEECPPGSQVGVVGLYTSLASVLRDEEPLYNMVTPRGTPALLGFDALGIFIYVHLEGGVRSDKDYELQASASDILARPRNPIYGARVELWGDPASATFDKRRGKCLNFFGLQSCPVAPGEESPEPLLTMPSACSGPLAVSASADSWEEPGVFQEREEPTTDLAGKSVGVEGCSALSFEPTLAVSPEAKAAESPTGLRVDLRVPQHEGLEELATSNLRDAKVALPAGIAINPSAATGQGSCAEEQIGYQPSEGQIHFSKQPDTCPASAKVGTVEVETPLLDHPLPGSVYLATPYENPFGSLLAIYVSVDDPQSGIVFKLAGKVMADAQTGQLTTTFDENPELPFEDFKLDFFGGPRAALRTPATCGSFATHGEFSPWSGNAPAQTTDSFQIGEGSGGRPCASNEAAMPVAPGFQAGTTEPIAAAYSPFRMNLSRADGEQQLRSLNLTLPPGLTARLAGVPACPAAALAAAEAHSGRAEEASPSCPSASEVGQVTVGAGAGPNPYYAHGKVYLAGPYKGAPLSLAVVTPAVAGPFDLGTVVTRAAVFVDPVTGQVMVKSDPLPTILAGIPLDVRDVRVDVTRPQFTRNPTSCETMAATGEAVSPLGHVGALADRFQVGGCSALAFKPRLKLRLKGATRRTGHPAVKAVVTASLGEADIARATVTLPHSEFLDQSHIRTLCTRVQFVAEQCPTGSIYGSAKAWSPLLDYVLEGPVYLRSSSHKLPDLVAALRGPASQPIEIDLDGRIDSVKGGRIRTTFEAVPDQPVSRFVLEMRGGKKGLLENSRNLCARHSRAVARLLAHNGAGWNSRPVVTNECGRHRRHAAKKLHGHRSKGNDR